MNPAIHHLKKDARYFRHLLAAWLLLVLLRAVLFQAVDPAASVRSKVEFEWMSLVLNVLQFTGAVGIVAQLIQNDPLVGTTAFWFTRPISRRTLLAGKSLFVLLFLISVPLLVEAVILFLNGTAFGDFAWLFLESSIKQLVLFIPIMVVAALTPNLSRFIVVGAVGVLAFSVAHLIPILLSDRFQSSHGSPTIYISQILAAYLLAVFFGSIVIPIQYLSRRTARSAFLAAFAVPVVAAAANLWPWDFLRVSERRLGEVFDAGSVVLSIDSGHHYVLPDAGGSRRVIGEVKVSGVGRGFVVSPVKIRSSIQFKGGATLQGKEIGYGVILWPPGLAPKDQRRRALGEVLGNVKLLDDGAAAETEMGLIRVEEDQFVRYRREAGRYSAEIEFQVLEYRLAGELPLRKNARYDRGSVHAVIEDAFCGSSGCVVNLRQSNPAIPWIAFPWQPPDVQYVLRSREKKEALLGVSNVFGFYNYGRWDWPLGLIIPSFQPLSRRNTLDFGGSGVPVGALDSSWFDKADLVRLEVVRVGKFSRTVQVDNFVMDKGTTK